MLEGFGEGRVMEGCFFERVQGEIEELAATVDELGVDIFEVALAAAPGESDVGIIEEDGMVGDGAEEGGSEGVIEAGKVEEVEKGGKDIDLRGRGGDGGGCKGGVEKE